MTDNTRTTSPEGQLASFFASDNVTVAPADGTAVNPVVPASPPGFDLLGEIGSGGMGAVYRARDRMLDREVAVKLLLPRYAPTSHTAARFLDEARITAQLQHPGIPAVYQVGELADGRPFLAMKLIKGQTLHELTASRERDRPEVPPFDPLAVFEAIAQAVGYAHAHGVIHRDLKPANIMVGAFGEVQVMDWGLAKVLANVPRPPAASSDDSPEATTIQSARDSDGSFTQAGSILGTPAFMPPEQAAGEVNRVGTPSDVFGLGAILCVLLTGKPPFGGIDAESVRLNAVRGKTEAAFARLDECGAAPDVVALCKRCLAFEPADRPNTADEVAKAVAELRRAADDRAEQAERAKLSATVRAAEQAKRHRAITWACAAIALLLLLGVVGTKIGLDRAEQARGEAEAAEHTADAKRIEAEFARAAEGAERKKAEVARIAAEAARTAEGEERQKADHARRVALANEAAAQAVVWFFENKVFAAARPKGQNGGLGKDVTLREALASSLSSLATDFTKQPLVEARLRKTLSSTFVDLGEVKAGLEQARAAWALYQQLDPDSYTRLSAAVTLAIAEQANGNTAEAIRVSEDALTRMRRVLGPDDELVFLTMNNLANYYTGARRHQESLDMRTQVLERYKVTYPPTHEKTLLAMFNMSRSLFNLGRHPEALELREQVLAGRRANNPDDHPLTLLAMNRLAASYVAVGRAADALKLREQTAAGQKAVLPADHPDLLTTLHELAHSYSNAGRYKEALPLREQVLAARRRVFPADHIQIVLAMNELAFTYINVGRKAEAVPLREEVLAARRRTFAPDAPETLRSMSLLAYSYATNGRPADALKLREEARPWFDKSIGPNHTDTLTNLWGIADNLVKLKRGAEAIPVIDLCVSRADPTVEERMLGRVLDLRLRHFQGPGDAAGCRATAEMYEKLKWTDSGSLYDAACNRGVAAELYATANQPAEAQADADRAMAWLTKAVAAGWRDRTHIEMDRDLTFLRARPDFQKLLASLPYTAPLPRSKSEQ